MSRVEVRSEWCFCDCLDGRDLSNGEFLCVAWPDGESTVNAIEVERSSEGTRDPVPVAKAFVLVEHHGMWARVRAVGLEARRVDAPSAKMYGLNGIAAPE